MTFVAQSSEQWEALLDFYIEAGINSVLDDTPHNRFEESSKLAKAVSAAPVMEQQIKEQAISAPSPQRATIPALATGSPDKAAENARLRAQSAKTLEELHTILASFDGCGLKFSAKSLVFADGNPKASIMLVGEAPGAEEDFKGKPFVGRSGMLLDRMLASIGLDRTSVYITNIIPWRPPGNRTPTPQEIAICKPFITRHIELVAPGILVTLGGPATQNLLAIKDGILKTRGRWFSYEGEKINIKALAMLHPAYLLRQPLQKRLAWRDLLALHRALKGD